MSQQLILAKTFDGKALVVSIIENRHGADRHEEFQELKSAIGYMEFIMEKSPSKLELEEFLKAHR